MLRESLCLQGRGGKPIPKWLRRKSFLKNKNSLVDPTMLWQSATDVSRKGIISFLKPPPQQTTMKNLLKSLLAAALIVAPAASYGQNFTGKTLKKSLVSTSAEAPMGTADPYAPFLDSESTPCYAIDQAVSLDDLIDIGEFFGLGLGDSNPILDVQAAGSTEIAKRLLIEDYDPATIHAFLLAQLKFIYNCP
jgi:hypothetical protein